LILQFEAQINNLMIVLVDGDEVAISDRVQFFVGGVNTGKRFYSVIPTQIGRSTLTIDKGQRI